MRAWPSWCAQAVWAITNAQGSLRAIDQRISPDILKKTQMAKCSPDKSAIGSEMVSTLTVLNNPQSRLKPNFSIFIPKLLISIQKISIFTQIRPFSSNFVHFHLILTAVAVVLNFLRVWRLQLRREPIVKFTARHNLWKGFPIWIFLQDIKISVLVFVRSILPIHFTFQPDLKDCEICFYAHDVSHCMTAPLLHNPVSHLVQPSQKCNLPNVTPMPKVWCT